MAGSEVLSAPGAFPDSQAQVPARIHHLAVVVNAAVVAERQQRRRRQLTWTRDDRDGCSNESAGSGTSPSSLRGLVLAALVSLANLRNRDFCSSGNPPPPPLSPPSPSLHPSRFRPAFRSWGSHTDTSTRLYSCPPPPTQTGSVPPEPDSPAPPSPFGCLLPNCILH